MKIVVSGTAGIGKTTLCNDLATRLEAVLIPENYNNIINSASPCLAARKKAPDLFARSPELKRFHSTAVSWINERIRLAKSHPKFISDRSPIDVLSIWVQMHLSCNDQNAQAQMIQLCKSAVADLDAVIFPPYLIHDMSETQNEAGISRAIDPDQSLLSHATVLGFYQMFVPGNIILIPDHISGREQRVDFVLKKINEKRSASAALPAGVDTIIPAWLSR